MHRFLIKVDGKEVDINTLPEEQKKAIFVSANRRAAEATGHVIIATEEKTA